MNLSSVVKKSKAVHSERFVETVANVISLLREESGKIGNFEVIERLVKLEPSGEALVIGDLHGDLESLISILETSGFPRKLTANKDATLIFSGRLRRPRRALSGSLLQSATAQACFSRTSHSFTWKPRRSK